MSDLELLIILPPPPKGRITDKLHHGQFYSVLRTDPEFRLACILGEHSLSYSTSPDQRRP